jgi:hypothetical protein
LDQPFSRVVNAVHHIKKNYNKHFIQQRRTGYEQVGQSTEQTYQRLLERIRIPIELKK